MTIGIGWGKTRSAAVPAIVPRNPEGIRVMSLLGGLTRVSAQTGMSDIFLRARSLDMAIVSVGDLRPHIVFRQYGLLTSEDLASLERAGAIGDVLRHFVDVDGNIVDHPVNRLVLAVNPNGLRGTRKIVRALGGWWKNGVISAALKLLQPRVLIVDELVAERLAGDAP